MKGGLQPNFLHHFVENRPSNAFEIELAHLLAFGSHALSSTIMGRSVFD